ncbi:LptA/OstA family protein [Azorhizobium oxalatiphilum]|uniref:LptA/OstA family protein n=1 Tax=Azorhizobium oxalatiphilum TaxID=980631 RepID=UPI001FCE8A02|nr:LptA/OstA family protein [Azorhizobium oxalatiphilum]
MSGSVSRGLLAAAVFACLAAPALAQPAPSGPPNALQGFATNRNEPIRINSDTLEVKDKEKQAVFAGKVVVTQGDTTLKAPQLLVYYDGDVAAGVQGSAQPTESSKIRKLEATGGVVVQTKDQTATGDTGVFEMKTNTVTMTGNPVVLTQGPNVIRGKRLVVDLTTGVSRFEGGRVESLIVPNSVKPDPAAQPRR